MKNSAFLLATLLLATLLLALASASAQTTIRIAADSSSGTYSKMLGEIIGVCSTDDFNIVPASGVTGGAPGNLDALVNNRADAAFLHSDVYTANAQADPTYNRFQTLVALYPEQIHILALRQSKTKKNLVFTVEFNSLSDLKGYKVGAAGGGVFTARILNGQGEAGYSVVPFDRGDEVISALTNGQIDAALFVGTNGPVKTMAAIATLLTRKFSTPAKIEAQAKLRACFDKHLGELQDNGSRSWQDVTPGDHGVLPWLDLPKTTAPSGKALIKKSNP
jgi:TRAP-type uncharacterized transport system substrate-binding protein